MGVASLGAIAALAGVGIAAAPARAGQLGWDNGTTNFFENIGNFADITDPQNDEFENFSVTFSSDGIALISNASDEFVPPFADAPPPSPTNTITPVTATFNYVDNSVVQLEGISEFLYTLDSDLTFNFGNGVTVTYGAGSTFQGEFGEDNVGNVVNASFEEVIAIGTDVNILGTIYTQEDPLLRVTGVDLEFADLPGGPGGEYDGLVAVESHGVPEPGTILGLLAVGGLGIAMKRKQQSKQLSA